MSALGISTDGMVREKKREKGREREGGRERGGREGCNRTDCKSSKTVLAASWAINQAVAGMPYTYRQASVKVVSEDLNKFVAAAALDAKESTQHHP